MTRTTRAIAILSAPILFGCASAPAGSSSGDMSSSGAMSSSATMSGMSPSRSDALHTAMRKLWSDHVIWTRNFIIDAAAGSPSLQVTTNRLLRNQDDIGNAIKPYYGDEAGNRLAGLLRQHILIAADLVNAAKAGDNAKVADADRRWHDNANDLATFLSGANPNWPKATVLSMLNDHLALTTTEATARLKGQWDQDAATFDSIYTQILGMADTLADGIVKQFPARF